jgi:hypothetical protein
MASAVGRGRGTSGRRAVGGGARGFGVRDVGRFKMRRDPMARSLAETAETARTASEAMPTRILIRRVDVRRFKMRRDQWLVPSVGGGARAAVARSAAERGAFGVRDVRRFKMARDPMARSLAETARTASAGDADANLDPADIAFCKDAVAGPAGRWRAARPAYHRGSRGSLVAELGTSVTARPRPAG